MHRPRGHDRRPCRSEPRGLGPHSGRLRREWSPQLGERRGYLGHLRRPRITDRHAAARSERYGYGRARLRDGVRLGLAGPARARPVGIDNSPAQLETARRFQEEFGLTFPLHLGDAEQTPFADESFDFAISEYGAAIWCDPYRWIPEAARILRPGGRLSFLGNSVLLMLTTPIDDEDAPADEQLQRPLFGMYRFAWEDGAVEFHLPHGEMIRLLREQRFRDRGPGRSGDRGGRDHPLPVRLAGVGRVASRRKRSGKFASARVPY